jgi:hypothetical protein
MHGHRVYPLLTLDLWMRTNFIEIRLGSDLGKSSFGSLG